MKNNNSSSLPKAQVVAIGLIGLIFLTLVATTMMALVFSGISGLRRFTQPTEYWGERVSEAEKSLKSSMQEYDSCMSNLEKSKHLSAVAVEKMISEGHPPEQVKKVAQDEIAKDEILCLAMEKRMKDRYDDLKYSLSKQSSVGN